MIQRLATFFALIATMMASAAFAEYGTQYRSETDRGIFSFGPKLGYTDSQFMNSDGSFAAYRGYKYGLELDIQLYGGSAGALNLFGTYLLADATGDPSEQKMKSRGTVIGAKAFAVPWFFIAAGAGDVSSTLYNTATNQEVTLNSRITGFAVGSEFSIGSQFILGFDLWYKSGPIKQSDNPNFTGNSFYQSTELFLNFIWSPPATTINVNRK